MPHTQAPATTVAARVPADLFDAFAAIAEREERTVSAELRRVMRRHVVLNATSPEAATPGSSESRPVETAAHVPAG